MDERIETIQAIEITMRQLTELLVHLSTKSEDTQQFFFDLVDYNQSLSVLTDLVPVTKKAVRRIELHEISHVLVVQKKLLERAVFSFEHQSILLPIPFGLTEGGIRRLLNSIKDILQVNSLLIQECEAVLQKMDKQDSAHNFFNREEPKKSLFEKWFKK